MSDALTPADPAMFVHARQLFFLAITAEMATTDGVAWNGQLLNARGTAVCRLEHRGDGGCLRWQWAPGYQLDRMRFEALAHRCFPDSFEPADMLVAAIDAAQLAAAEGLAADMTPFTSPPCRSHSR